MKIIMFAVPDKVSDEEIALSITAAAQQLQLNLQTKLLTHEDLLPLKTDTSSRDGKFEEIVRDILGICGSPTQNPKLQIASNFWKMVFGDNNGFEKSVFQYIVDNWQKPSNMEFLRMRDAEFVVELCKEALTVSV